MNTRARRLQVQQSFSLIMMGLTVFAPSAWGRPPALSSVKSAAHIGQASDGDVKVISDLVHAGNYAVAQQLTVTLLTSYPNDPRLIRAKALLDKLLAEQPGNPAPGAVQPAGNATPVQQQAIGIPGRLTGMDRVDYDALIQRAQEAQQTTDLAQQKTLLNQLMDDSRHFLQKHPDQMLIWQLRAASALSLDDPDAGYEAGQKLIAEGAADSNDANLRQLLAQLKNKGWLDVQRVGLAKQNIEENKKYGWILGGWHGAVSFSVFGSNHQYEYDVDFSKSGSAVLGLVRGQPNSDEQTGRDTFFSYKYATANLEDSTLPKKWEVSFSSKWHAINSFSLDPDKKTMRLVYDAPVTPGQRTFGMNSEVTIVFTKIEDPQR